MFKKYFVLFACFHFLIAVNGHADTLKSENEIRPFSDKLMDQVAKGKLESAFITAKPYFSISQAEFDSLVLKSKTQREQFGSRYGKTVGYEFISEQKLGESLVRLVYIEKTDRHALPWIFLYYKSPQGWVFNSIAWNDQPLSIYSH